MKDEPTLEQNWELGPHLLAALLCERLLEEKDGINSIIRIIDQLIIQAAGHDVPSQLPKRAYEIWFFLLLKTGEQPGACPIEIKIIKPDLSSPSSFKQTVHLESPGYRGLAVRLHMALEIDQVGVWWFEVFVKGIKRTRVPLHIVYLPQAT
jgi:hypothetical protein